jgi:hypothetical protein
MITAFRLWLLRLKLRLVDHEILGTAKEADEALLRFEVETASYLGYYAQELRAERSLLKARIRQLSTNAKKGKQP